MRLYDRTPVAQDRVVELQRHIRFRVVGSPDHPCRAIELSERQEARRHSVLGIEVLVAYKGHEVVGEVTWQKMVSRLPVQPSHLARNIRIDTCTKLRQEVNLIGPCNVDASELPPKIEPREAVTAVELEDTDAGVDVPGD